MIFIIFAVICFNMMGLPGLIFPALFGFFWLIWDDHREAVQLRKLLETKEKQRRNSLKIYNKPIYYNHQ